MALKGEKVFFAVPKGDDVDKYVDMVTELGGKVSRQFNSGVTCVVFRGGSKEHWKKAEEFDIPLVDPTWLKACKDAKKKVAVKKGYEATQGKVGAAAKKETKNQEEEKGNKAASTKQEPPKNKINTNVKLVKEDSVVEASEDLRDSGIPGREESTNDEVDKDTNGDDNTDEVKGMSDENEPSSKGQQAPNKKGQTIEEPEKESDPENEDQNEKEGDEGKGEDEEKDKDSEKDEYAEKDEKNEDEGKSEDEEKGKQKGKPPKTKTPPKGSSKTAKTNTKSDQVADAEDEQDDKDQKNKEVGDSELEDSEVKDVGKSNGTNKNSLKRIQSKSEKGTEPNSKKKKRILKPSPKKAVMKKIQ